MLQTGLQPHLLAQQVYLSYFATEHQSMVYILTTIWTMHALTDLAKMHTV